MASLNKVMLIGNLTRDPEVRYTPKGVAVTDITLAINRFYTTEGGEKKEDTTFVDVTLWNRQAELAGKYLTKGRPLYVEGRLQMDTWVDKNSGENRSKLRIVGENMQFLGGQGQGTGGGGGFSGGRDDDSGYSNPPASSSPSSSAPASAPSSGMPLSDDEDDDIPF